MLKKIIIFLFIGISLLVSICCSCGNKTNNNESYPSNSVSRNIQNSAKNTEFNPTKRTEDLEKAIEEKTDSFEQLKSAFYELDNHNPLIDNEFDSISFLDFTLNIFKKFLETEQAYDMTEVKYNVLSTGIKVFPVKNGRIFTYGGTALLFGDSGRTTFAFLQTKQNNKIKISVLYDNVQKDILNIIQPSEDKNFIVIAGSDRNQQGSRAYMEGFYYENGMLTKKEILKNYNDDLWCVDSKDGTIFLVHAVLAQSVIKNINEKEIEVEAGNAKLILSFENKSNCYIIKK